MTDEIQFNSPRYADGSPAQPLPSSVVSWDEVQGQRSAAALEARKRAFAQMEVDAQRARERAGRIEAGLRERLSQAMPAAGDLGVAVTGLAAARERLVCGLAWCEQERQQIAVLEGKLAAFVTSLGAPAATKQEIEHAEGLVAAALRKFFHDGSRGAPPDLQTVAREALVAKLAEQDAMAAEIAGGLLRECEEEIEVQRAFVARLEKRVAGWRADALVEVGQPIATRVQKLLDDLRLEVAALSALGQVAGGSLRAITDGAKIYLGCSLPYDIEGADGMPVPGGERVEPIASEWRAALSKIEADPRATVSAPRSRKILPVPKAKPAIIERVVQMVKPPKPAAEPVPEDFSGMFEFVDHAGPLG
jgi:hypothetical protein